MRKVVTRPPGGLPERVERLHDTWVRAVGEREREVSRLDGEPRRGCAVERHQPAQAGGVCDSSRV